MVDAPVTPELAGLEAEPARAPRPLLGYAMVAGAVALWAANATVAKVILESGLSSYRLAEARTTGGAALFLLAAALTRPRALRPRRHELASLVAFGVLGLAFVQFFFFVGIERLEIGVAIVIQYLAPVLVALWARFVVREPVRRRLWLAIVVALVGLSLVVDLYGGLSLDGTGVGACLLAALAYVAYILLAERHLRQGRDVLSLLALGFLVATVFWTLVQPWWSFPGRVLGDDVDLLGRLAGTSAPAWVLLLLVVSLGTFVPFVLMVGALHHVPATGVTIVAMLEPVLAAIVAFAWLGEELTAGQIAGGLLVLGGVAIARTARLRGPLRG